MTDAENLTKRREMQRQMFALNDRINAFRPNSMGPLPEERSPELEALLIERRRLMDEMPKASECKS
jgi:hypothetical protein